MFGVSGVVGDALEVFNSFIVLATSSCGEAGLEKRALEASYILCSTASAVTLFGQGPCVSEIVVPCEIVPSRGPSGSLFWQ